MRLLLTTISLFIFNVSYSQVNDTLFLKKEKSHAVYILNDTSSQRYYRLANYHLDAESDKHLKEFLIAFLSKEKLNVHHFQNKDLPSQWCPLYLLKNVYYVYNPSDWLAHFNCGITDSAITIRQSSSFDAQIIVDYNKIGNTEFHYKIARLNRPAAQINIKIIDKKKMLALWEFKSETDHYYQLMTDVKNVKQFPMVVCNCGEMKCNSEYQFEEINESIIAKYGW
jgi:hypothetical protein